MTKTSELVRDRRALIRAIIEQNKILIAVDALHPLQLPRAGKLARVIKELCRKIKELEDFEESQKQ